MKYDIPTCEAATFPIVGKDAWCNCHDQAPTDGKHHLVKFPDGTLGTARYLRDDDPVPRRSVWAHDGRVVDPLAWRQFPRHDVALAGSWKRRDEVRELATWLRRELAARTGDEAAWRRFGRVREISGDRPFSVFDFTDPACRVSAEMPPEGAPRMWLPEESLVPCGAWRAGEDGPCQVIPPCARHPNPGHPAWDRPPGETYESYLSTHRPGIADAMLCNYITYATCRVCVLVLPCGCDAHFDLGVAAASGARTVVYGAPAAGDRHPVHLGCDAFVRRSDLDSLLRAVLS